jgi:1-aminocyclopropane-1-carboxylate deaminase/D-cysteine desulfhydrase-like pyridoxal-dependent ACC family enzyme
MSDVYAQYGRARPIGPAFVALAALAPVAVITLIVAGLLYYSGSSARIANTNTAVAAPASQALTAEVGGYTHNRRHHLAAAKSDLRREAKTVAAFDNQLALVTFPGAAGTAAGVLIQADMKRIKLIGLQAQSTSLRQLRSFGSADQATTAAAEIQVGRIRQALGLPPSSGGGF